MSQQKKSEADLEDLNATPPAPRSWYHKLWFECQRHASFVGPGILASVAYFDPGNWATDLAAGSQFGYGLLFVVLCAGLGAILFQTLSARLGIVTGMDLAQHLRAGLHSRRKHKMFWRWGVLYPLYALAELAIIATDLAELLGSAIALNLLFPKLPLYAGVLITAFDVLLVLLAYRPNGGARSMRVFEITIALLVLAVFICFIILLFRISPSWDVVFRGYLPSKVIGKPGALYTSIGIIGATVMPHALFLGSRLSTIHRLEVKSTPASSSQTFDSAEPGMVHVKYPPQPQTSDVASKSLPRGLANLKKVLFQTQEDHVDGVNRTVDFIKTHIWHASIDIVLSLFCFAITINSAILIVASAAFYYGLGQGGSGSIDVGDLFDAYDLIKEYVGKASAFLFAFALLCAGQSASITATLAGQVVSEGFLRWRLSPFLRRLVTRLLGIIPAVTISVAMGRKGLDTLLVGSQVLLSIVLPFVVFPLVLLTSRYSGVMRIPITATDASANVNASVDTLPMVGATQTQPQTQPPPEQQRYQDFSSAWYVTFLGFGLVAIMLAANMYVIIQLALGK